MGPQPIMEPDSREAVAQRLEAVREYYGITTRRELASAAEVTEQMYSDIMRGRRDVSRATARKLAEHYSLTLDFIYFGNKSALPHTMAMAL